MIRRACKHDSGSESCCVPEHLLSTGYCCRTGATSLTSCHLSFLSSFMWPVTIGFTSMSSATWSRETQVLADSGANLCMVWPCPQSGWLKPLLCSKLLMLLCGAAARSGVNRYMIALLLQFIVAEKKLDVLQASALCNSACTLGVMCLVCHVSCWEGLPATCRQIAFGWSLYNTGRGLQARPACGGCFRDVLFHAPSNPAPGCAGESYVSQCIYYVKLCALMLPHLNLQRMTGADLHPVQRGSAAWGFSCMFTDFFSLFDDSINIYCCMASKMKRTAEGNKPSRQTARVSLSCYLQKAQQLAQLGIPQAERVLLPHILDITKALLAGLSSTSAGREVGVCRPAQVCTDY